MSKKPHLSIAKSGRVGNRATAERLTNVELVKRAEDIEELEGHQLLLRASDGDERAVTRLYRAHASPVRRHVARVLGPNDPELDDVVQQVFLAALKNARTFEGRSKLSTWLHGIATRRALDAARSRWRRNRWRRVTDRVGLGRAEGRPDVAHAAVDEAHRILGQLEPELRTVFVLKEVEGHTFAEISAMTRVKISTLHARLKSARKKIDVIVARERVEGGRHA